MLRRRLALASALGLLFAGCGTSVTPPKTVPETMQRPAPLPAGWHRRIDYLHGFSIGVPPGWTAKSGADVVRFLPPDQLVAVSLTTDRSQGLRVPVDALARQTLEQLSPGYEQKLEAGPSRQLGGTPLDAAVVSSGGVAKQGGVRQSIELAVLRRPRFVDYTGVVTANAAAAPPAERALGLRMLRTIRDVPISPAPDPESRDVNPSP